MSLRTPIEAQAPALPRYGLRVAAPVLEDVDEAIWGRGVQWSPEQCSEGITTALIDCSGTLGTMTMPDDVPDTAHADPLVVVAGEECSTFTRDRDLEGRARRNLDASLSWAIAGELWMGYQARQVTDPDEANRYFVSEATEVIGEEAAAVADVIGCLEAAVADCILGRRAMLHVTPQLLTALVGASLVYRDGGLWLTPMGSIVVADAGYTGDGPVDGEGIPEPAGATQWAYATGIVSLRLGAVGIFASDDQSIATDNTRRAWAWRPTLTQFDCCVVGLEVDLATCETPSEPE